MSTEQPTERKPLTPNNGKLQDGRIYVLRSFHDSDKRFAVTYECEGKTIDVQFDARPADFKGDQMEYAHACMQTL